MTDSKVLARDLVRHINQIRALMGLEYAERATATYATEDAVLLSAIAEHRAWIQDETRCDLTEEYVVSMKDIDLSGRALRLIVTAPMYVEEQ